MEQRKQLKDSVKQKVIEFMAEQITKEESFLDLKTELVDELFITKEVIEPIEDDLGRVLDSNDGFTPMNDRERAYKRENGFLFNKEAVEKRFENLKKSRDEFGGPSITRPITDSTSKESIVESLKKGDYSAYMKAMRLADERNKNIIPGSGFQFPEPRNLKSPIEGIRQGYNDGNNGFQFPEPKSPISLIDGIKQGGIPTRLKGFLQDFPNSPSVDEILKDIESRTKYNPENFQEYSLKYSYKEAEKEIFRALITEFIKNNETQLGTETFNNEPNYYKKFNLKNSSIKSNAPDSDTLGSAKNDFNLNISFIYNKHNNSYFINNFECTLGSRYMMNKDLGLLFAVEVLTLINHIEKKETNEINEHLFKNLEEPKLNLASETKKMIKKSNKLRTGRLVKKSPRAKAAIKKPTRKKKTAAEKPVKKKI